MANKFTITAEVGDLSEWTGTTTIGAGSQVQNTAASAMFGSRGFEAEVNGVASAQAQFEKDFTIATSDLRLGYYFDPNSCTMVDGDIYYNCWILCDGTVGGIDLLFAVRHEYTAANGHRMRTVAKEDDNTSNWGTTFDITDAPHWVELHCERGAGTGRLRIWVDEVLKSTVDGGLDNQDLFVTCSQLQIGFRSSVDVGTDGICYYDHIILNDDGAEIGPPSVGVPVMMFDYRRRRV